MIVEKLIKFGLVFVFIYFIYKMQLHQKVYKVLNKFTNNTREFQIKASQRKKYIKKLLKDMKHNSEI